MSAHDPGFAGRPTSGLANWRYFIERWNIYPARAACRAVVFIIVGGVLFGCLLDIPDEVDGGPGRIADIIISAVMMIVLLLTFRRFGQGRGMLRGAWLTVISYFWSQGIVMTAYTAWIAAGMDETPTDWDEVTFFAVCSAIVLVPTTLGLRRIDPDY